MFYWVLKILLGPIVRILWVKRVEGLNNIPLKGPLIIASNHSSYFDFITLVAIFPRRIHFLAAEVFYRNPYWRPLMILTGQIKVDRESRDKSEAKKQINKYLQEGKVIGIFPEGTRSRSGKMQRAFTGVGKIALENKVNILPVAIAGAFDVMSPISKKPALKKIIKVNFLKLLEYSKFKVEKEDIITHQLLMPLIAKSINEEYPDAE